MAEDWTRIEVEAIVADYFAMWELELRGNKFNKSDHNKRLQEKIPPRSKGSIERKHQNISAILWHLGYPYINGYKPLPNYQGLLREVVEARLIQAGTINELVAIQVRSPTEVLPPIRVTGNVLVPPPNAKKIRRLIDEDRQYRTEFIPKNFIEVEASNRSLGSAGEKFILHFEQERLWRAGKRNLADRVEHVAVTKGDFLGYDILSFELNGGQKFIEVKTTRYGAMTRFYASSNEIEVSDCYKDSYCLYRLFNFERKPQFFVLAGSLLETCDLKPVNFWALPKTN